MSNRPLVTPDSVADLVYEAGAGVQYQLTGDCTRVMKRVTIGLDKQYSQIMSDEVMQEIDTESDRYWINVRMKAIEFITEGDDLPESYDDIDIEVMNRVIADFFRLRYAKAAPQISLSATTNEIQA